MLFPIETLLGNSPQSYCTPQLIGGKHLRVQGRICNGLVFRIE